MVSDIFGGRLDGLLDDNHESHLHQKPSRDVGKQSRGPEVTEGILAPGDPGDDGRSYRIIRAELIAEFRPTGQSKKAIIDGLARDYVQLDHFHAMIEELQQPPLPARDLRQWNVAQAADRNLRLLKSLLGENGTMNTCIPDEAKRLAAIVVSWVESTEADLAAEEMDDAEYEAALAKLEAEWAMCEARWGKGKALRIDEMLTAPPSGPSIPERSKEAEEFERLEQQEFDELVQIIRTGRALLMDAARVEGLLSGAYRYMAGERESLRAMLEQIALQASRQCRMLPELQERIRRLQEQYLRALANNPETLFALQRHCVDLESGIDRKLRQLRKH